MKIRQMLSLNQADLVYEGAKVAHESYEMPARNLVAHVFESEDAPENLALASTLMTAGLIEMVVAKLDFRPLTNREQALDELLEEIRAGVQPRLGKEENDFI